jgi:hypothetical protein
MAQPQNLLQIIQAVTGELGLVQPSIVIGASDLQTVQLYNLANREGDALRRAHNWTAMQSLFTLNVGSPTVTTGTLANGSPVISAIPSTAGIVAGLWVATAANLPAAARVLSVDSSTQVTMDMVATGNATATTVTFSQDTYPEPAGFDRFINRTAWDRTNRWELIGPDSPQTDEWHRSGIVTTGPRRHFRQVGDLSGGNYRIWPPPQSVDTPFQIAWEYISNFWVQSATGTNKASFTADTDVPVLDSQAIILGTKWRFAQAKSLPSAASLQIEWNEYISQLIGRDGGAPTLKASKRAGNYLLTAWNVQDNNWPGNP